MATEDLHDALVDTRQLPIIAAGIERLGGPAWSLASLVRDTSETGLQQLFADVKAQRLERLLKRKDLGLASLQKLAEEKTGAQNKRDDGAPAERAPVERARESVAQASSERVKGVTNGSAAPAAASAEAHITGALPPPPPPETSEPVSHQSQAQPAQAVGQPPSPPLAPPAPQPAQGADIAGTEQSSDTADWSTAAAAEEAGLRVRSKAAQAAAAVKGTMPAPATPVPMPKPAPKVERRTPEPSDSVWDSRNDSVMGLWCAYRPACLHGELSAAHSPHGLSTPCVHVRRAGLGTCQLHTGFSQAVERCLASHDRKPPALTAQVHRCRHDAPQDRVRLLQSEDVAHGAVASAWHPFTAPLASAGIPKAVMRKPTLAKLEAAGFTSLLDVRCLLRPSCSSCCAACCSQGARTLRKLAVSCMA